jgi:hypothetical protein
MPWVAVAESQLGSDCGGKVNCSASCASASRACKWSSHVSGALASNICAIRFRISVRGLQVPPAKHTSHAHGKNKMRVSRTVLVGANLRRHLDSSLRTARRIAADW